MIHGAALHLMGHPAAGSAFRTFVGYPLFGGAFRNLWPLLLMPLLAAFIGERAARTLPRTPQAWIPAAILAALPGLVALTELWPALTANLLNSGITWRGVMLLWVTPAAGLALGGYALLRAILRQRELGRLFRAAAMPCERLASMAAALQLRARELPTADKECFVAGVFRPTVFISRGALVQLGDAELLAALHHERAHIRSRDTLLLCLLSVLRDLVPWAPASALEAYQMTRESAADREAAARAGSLNLAAALVALARSSPRPTTVLPMAKAETLRWRMQAILEGDEAAPARSFWPAAAAGLGFGLALMAWPLAQLQLLSVFCWS
ncbi:MAG TPA: M56 family metallopeptidase [Steroidobacteraceae bacterium]